MKLGCLLLILSCFLIVPALASPEIDIKSSYERLCRATGLKYLPGMMSNRSSDFKAFSSDGREINLLGEEQKLATLLANSLSARETVKFRSTVKNSDGTYTCHVEDRLIFLIAQRESEPKEFLIVTESKDTWKQTPLGWRQTQSRLIRQTVEKSGE